MKSCSTYYIRPVREQENLDRDNQGNLDRDNQGFLFLGGSFRDWMQEKQKSSILALKVQSISSSHPVFMQKCCELLVRINVNIVSKGP